MAVAHIFLMRTTECQAHCSLAIFPRLTGTSAPSIQLRGCTLHEMFPAQRSSSVSALIIGAMKCGTTQLFHTLATHPQVVACALKEPNFFVDHPNVGNWSRGAEWYASLFRDRPGLRLEASTAYTKDYLDTGVALRIRSFCPDAKLIFLFRDPVDRATSHYLHSVTEQREERPIDEAMLDLKSNYVRLSLYHEQLRPYLGLFPRNQIFVLRAETLWLTSEETIVELQQFLGIDVKTLALSPNRHSTADRIARFKRAAADDDADDDADDVWLPGISGNAGRGTVPGARDLGDSLGVTAELRRTMMQHFVADYRRLQDLLTRRMVESSRRQYTNTPAL
jgi:hypothetical protein